jgi:hypothetical protein
MTRRRQKSAALLKYRLSCSASAIGWSNEPAQHIIVLQGVGFYGQCLADLGEAKTGLVQLRACRVKVGSRPARQEKPAPRVLESWAAVVSRCCKLAFLCYGKVSESFVGEMD